MTISAADVLFAHALEAIIAERPSFITRIREVPKDPFRAPDVTTAGPYRVRIEPLQAFQVDTYDEKGNVASLRFQLLGVDLPETVLEDGVPQPLFRINDVLIDDRGQRYRVMSPPYYRYRVVVVVIEHRAS